jgi:6-phosphogluconate dehydrogenase
MTPEEMVSSVKRLAANWAYDAVSIGYPGPVLRSRPVAAELWRRGSVIASCLLDLTAAALAKDPALTNFADKVTDSGEGRWMIKAAIDEAVPVPVLSTALFERFSSRGEATFGDKLLPAMRYEFGGHLEKSAG